MTMQKTLHPRDIKNNNSVPSKTEREFADCDDCVDANIQRLEEYTQKRRKKVRVAKNSSINSEVEDKQEKNEQSINLENKNG